MLLITDRAVSLDLTSSVGPQADLYSLLRSGANLIVIVNEAVRLIPLPFYIQPDEAVLYDQLPKSAHATNVLGLNYSDPTSYSENLVRITSSL